MKADLNDAPDYLRARSSRGSTKGLITAGVVGVCVTFGLLGFTGSAFMDGAAKNFTSPNYVRPATDSERTLVRNNKITDWDHVVEQQARRDREKASITTPDLEAATSSQVKQTSYHDKNYVPRGAYNVVPAIKPDPIERKVERPKSQKEIVVVGKETRLKDYCPFRQGSLQQRNCKMRTDLDSR